MGEFDPIDPPRVADQQGALEAPEVESSIQEVIRTYMSMPKDGPEIAFIRKLSKKITHRVIEKQELLPSRGTNPRGNTTPNNPLPPAYVPPVSPGYEPPLPPPYEPPLPPPPPAP